MEYATIKHLHMAAVAVSVLGFLVRGVAGLLGRPWVRRRMARTLPHVVDTVLLVSALTLVYMANLNPLHTPWVAAKIIGLLIYVGLGVVTLRPRVPLQWRATALLLALLTVAWMGSVAVTKQPWGFFALS
jgi:uncharacterized membrane protein SirB2